MSRQIITTKRSPAAENRRKIILFGSIAMVAILLIVALALANRVPETASTAPIDSKIKVGDAAPDFTVSSTGGPFTLSTSSGRPTMLEVFATWCPHCQREAPIISRLAAEFKGRVNVVGVDGSPYAIDESSPETQNDVVNWADKFGATYPVAYDQNLDVAHKYLQGGFPTVVLIGTDGKVQSIRSGEMPPSDIETALNAMLSGKKPDPKLGLKG